MPQFKFLSEEWLVEVEKIIRRRITPETIKYATTSVLTIFEGCPDESEKALFFETSRGEITQIKSEGKPYPKAEFTVSGDYSAYMKVFRGNLEPGAAIMSGELKFHGNLFRAMGMVSVLEPFYKALAEIPTNFE